MPHVQMMIVRANELLGNRSLLPDVSQRLAGATTLPAAVDALDLLDAVDEQYHDEARLALEAVPAAVEQALLGAVVNAASRGIPVIIQWKPGSHVELQVWEAVADDLGHVGILLISPRAIDLAASG